MNKIFGFFKQKISQAKQQNKQQLQTLTQALTEGDYSRQKVLNLLQVAKTNYMNWNIIIANEASTGLYYSQMHNRNICMKKIKGNKQIIKNLQKDTIKLKQLQKTHEQLSKIEQLNSSWAPSMNNQVENITKCIQKIYRNIDQTDKQIICKEAQKQLQQKEQVQQKQKEQQKEDNKLLTSQAKNQAESRNQKSQINDQ